LHELGFRTYRNDLHGWYHTLVVGVAAGRGTSLVGSAPSSRVPEMTILRLLSSAAPVVQGNTRLGGQCSRRAAG
jgi:hypothetical protein